MLVARSGSPVDCAAAGIGCSPRGRVEAEYEWRPDDPEGISPSRPGPGRVTLRPAEAHRGCSPGAGRPEMDSPQSRMITTAPASSATATASTIMAANTSTAFAWLSP
jgi:hypothetical protein